MKSFCKARRIGPTRLFHTGFAGGDGLSVRTVSSPFPSVYSVVHSRLETFVRWGQNTHFSAVAAGQSKSPW